MPKISERSLYRKIQSVVEEAGRGGFTDFESLISKIIKNPPLQFTRYEKIKESETRVVPCKEDSVRRVVYFTAELGLIDGSTGKLAKAGTQAMKRDYFDRVMRQQIANTLKNRGISQTVLFDTIKSMLADGKAHNMPSWDAIYNRLSSDNNKLSRKDFHVFLTLLSYSGAIAYIQKRIFLPHHTQ
jgi:hypothetical protein